ncbi:MAG: hypothetical protein ABFD91_00370 [Anaerohalosphaeraceae bacterium]
MITEETVLILGAGASMTYGFPSGKQLKALIWEQLRRDNTDIYPIINVNTNNSKSIHLHKAFAQEFRDNLLLSPDESIDSFLEYHEDYRRIGKLLITNILLRYEKRQFLFDQWLSYLINNNKDKETPVRFSDGHWYQLLFNQMCKDCKFEDFPIKNKASIITFNYDRSLEYYLLTCLHAKYKRSLHECSAVLLKIPILHIYGKLGELPELSPDPKTAIPYDNLDNHFLTQYLRTAEDSIKIIHDPNTHTSPEFQEAQKLIKNATRIYFLGFGFLKENLKRLFTDYSNSNLEFGLLGNTSGTPGAGGKCFGTMLGISPHHKHWLAQRGFNSLQYELASREKNPHSLRFPDSTIYDFLFYNVHTRFD